MPPSPSQKLVEISLRIASSLLLSSCLDLPGEIAGVVALDELVIHGWDVARASGQPFDVDAQSLDAIENFVQGFSADGTPGLFGPRVAVPDSAPHLDRVIGMTGRDPNWLPNNAG